MLGDLGGSAIGWVHFRLAGGMRQMVVVGAAYAAILVGLSIFMTWVSSAGPVGAMLQVQVMGLMFLQGVVLLLFGVVRVTGAIRLDLSSNMMESHRLMPVGPGQAVMGYVFGATAQSWVLAGVNVVATVVLGTMGGMNVGELLVGHMIMISFAIFVWMFAAMGTMAARGWFGVVWLSPVLVVMSSGMLLYVLPGAMLLLSPLLGRTVFGQSSEPVLTPAHVVSAVGQAVFGSMFFVGAARRYRQPEKPAFLPFMGVVLVGAWVALSLVGMEGVSGMDSWIREERISGVAKFLGSMSVALLLMIVPAVNAAWYFDYARRHRPEISPVQREVWALGAVLGAVAICLLLSRGVRVAEQGIFSFRLLDVWRVGVLGMSALGYGLGIHYMMRIMHRGGRQRAGFPVLAWVLVTWFFPVLVDVTLAAIWRGEFEWTFVGSMSPIGTMMGAFGVAEVAVSPAAGAGVQLLVGVGMGVLYYLTGARRKKTERKASSELEAGS